MNSEFYSVKETAKIFSVHEVTIRRAIKKGYLIAIRMGEGKKSAYRISRKSIDAIHTSIISALSKKSKIN